MTIKEFVDSLKNSNNTEMTCSKRIVNKYVPYQDKVAQCQMIVENTTKIKVGDSDIYHKNSPAQYIVFALTLISLYTDVEIDFEHILDSYNGLNEFGGIEGLLKSIPQPEYDEFDTVLHMVVDDYYENTRSIVGYLDSKLQIIEMFFKSLMETEEVKNILASEDFKKILEKQ